MRNHKGKGKRPLYLAIVDGSILWFVPLSSKIDKYKKIINNKIYKYGLCDTILIRKVLGKETAILLQNAFPCTIDFIDHQHLMNNGIPAKVISKTAKEIEDKLVLMFAMRKKGKNLFLVDINKILKNIKNEKLSTTS
ncbi:MAG: hypothetical protein J5634_04245 [Bacilli bacterium]|nr:hypothetical protein [Bacilli bacterium]